MNWQFPWFESCVVSDGNQTADSVDIAALEFESCVVSDGNQTIGFSMATEKCLRVVLFLMVTKPSGDGDDSLKGLRVVLFLMVTKQIL